jgi:carboxyl-terminal processing protease
MLTRYLGSNRLYRTGSDGEALLVRQRLALLVVLAGILSLQVAAALAIPDAEDDEVPSAVQVVSLEALTAYLALMNHSVEAVDRDVLLEGAWQEARRAAGMLNYSRSHLAEPNDAITADMLALLKGKRRSIPLTDIAEYYISGMAKSADDPHTSYIPPSIWQAATDGEARPYFGFATITHNGVVRVWEVRPNSPALEAGLKVGDVILASNVDGDSWQSATARLRVARGAEILDLTIKPILGAGWPTEVRSFSATVAYLRVFTFNAQGAVFRLAIEAAAPLIRDRDTIFDLRSNGGGSSSNLAYLLLKIGLDPASITFVDRDGTTLPVEASVAPRELTRPRRIVVLVNEGTFSAAELLAGALQRSAGATVIGAGTAGVTHGATYFDLGRGGLQVATYRSLVGPAGEDLEDVGVTPDLVMEADFEGLIRGQDNVLQRAIDLLSAGQQ